MKKLLILSILEKIIGKCFSHLAVLYWNGLHP